MSGSRSPACETALAIGCTNRILLVLHRLLLLVFIKHRKRLAPCSLLLVVDLAEIENGSLYRLVGSDAMVFYDAEIAMIFAVFFAIVAAQKHADRRLPEVRGRREDTWSPLYRFFRERR